MNLLRCIFSFACFSAAFGMTVFWCYKFWMDEDLCEVDYKSFESSVEVDYPMLSFCLKNPFIESKLKNYNESFSISNYIKFLKSHEYYPGIENVSLNDVTLNLDDFYIKSQLEFRNGTYREFYEKPKVNQLGHTKDTFFKCYGVKFEDRGVKCAVMLFKSNEIANMSVRNYVAMLHLPNQKAVAVEKAKYLWPKRYEQKQFSMIFKIDQVEILRRRNKRSKPCVPNSVSYDNKIINEYIRKNGCRAPYQITPKDVPLCVSKDGIVGASLDLWTIREDVSPCTTASNIIYTYNEENHDDNGIEDHQDLFWIGLCFPNKFKEIKQQRAVDIQTVIGNAGGYVGLFLGNQIIF